MITFNFLYSTNNNLRNSIESIDFSDCSGILVRIHTSIHNEKKAVSLASFIKNLIPECKIIGTSTSDVIFHGKIIKEKCLVSITKLKEGCVKTAIMSAYDDSTQIDPEILCRNVKNTCITDNTKLLFVFFTSIYADSYNFIEKANEIMPGVPVIGGLANSAEVQIIDRSKPSFVFNENTALNDGVVFASLSGNRLESLTTYVTGAEPMNDELEITSSFGTAILGINNKDGAGYYAEPIGDIIRKDPSVANIFPLCYAENNDIPFNVLYYKDTSIKEIIPDDSPYCKAFYASHKSIPVTDEKKDYIITNHNVVTGKKIKRAFVYDKKIISENHQAFSKIQNFEKAETMFAYSCILRSIMYSNCARWEISPYEDTELSGCLLTGEFVHINKTNTNAFANCSFVLSTAGESCSTLPLNEYVLKNTSVLSKDNYPLLEYLIKSEKYFEKNNKKNEFELIGSIRKEFEKKILLDEEKKIANFSRLLFDIKLEKTDKVCAVVAKNIDVFKTFLDAEDYAGLFDFYLHTILKYSMKKRYTVYLGDKQDFYISASIDIPLQEFVNDMHELFDVISKSNFLGYSPTYEFCIINNFSANELLKKFDSAFLNMRKNGELFYVCKEDVTGDAFFSQQIEMVKIINNAIAKDKIIPFFQGIYNNNTGKIDLYEALMRIEDDNGKIYYPNQFLDVARDFCVLYDKISFIMIKKVLNTFADKPDLKVTMNLSITDLKNNDIVTYIFDFLENCIHPENYIFEIVENEDIDDYDYIREFATRIHRLKAKIALDDFGSGYSNFMHIVNMNFDYIKIDGEIIKQCTKNEKCRSIVKILSLYKKEQRDNIRIVAEYVENKEIQDLIYSSGIDYSQGYYFSKPERLFNM